MFTNLAAYVKPPAPTFAIGGEMSAQLEILEGGPSPQFTAADAVELQRHEATIEKNLAAFVAVGEALSAIRAKRYYLMTHLTFESYALEKWGLGRADAYRAIEAAEVMADLSPIGDAKILPLNPSQTRPLARLEPEQRQPAWEKAVELAGDDKPTARHVEQAVQFIRGGVPTIEEDAPEPSAPLSGGESFYAPLMKPKPEAVKADPVETPAIEPAKAKAKYAGDEWDTPEKYVAAVRNVLGHIDLDPASCKRANAKIKAVVYFTKEDDGLSKDWEARTLYLNPPYRRGLIAPFVLKLIESVEAGIVGEAIMLVNANTSSSWFKGLWAYTLCFVDGRIKFDPGEEPAEESEGEEDEGPGSARAASVFVYFGNRPERFAKEFAQFGRIARAWGDWSGVPKGPCPRCGRAEWFAPHRPAGSIGRPPLESTYCPECVVAIRRVRWSGSKRRAREKARDAQVDLSEVHWPAGVTREEYAAWKTEQHALGVTENINPREYKRRRDAGLGQ